MASNRGQVKMDWNIIIQKYDGLKIVHNGITQHIKITVSEAMRTTDFYIDLIMFGFSRLRLIAEYCKEKNLITIRDIQVKKEDRNLGYGSLVMDILLDIGSLIGAVAYTGFLSEEDINDPNDPEHKNRLVHFYQKYGFTVDLIKRHIEKNSTVKDES